MVYLVPESALVGLNSPVYSGGAPRRHQIKSSGYRGSYVSLVQSHFLTEKLSVPLRRFIFMPKYKERIFDLHHDDPSFSPPVEDDMLKEIVVCNAKQLLTDETAYILCHLVRALCRTNSDEAATSDSVLVDLYSSFYDEKSRGADVIDIRVITGGPTEDEPDQRDDEGEGIPVKCVS